MPIYIDFSIYANIHKFQHLCQYTQIFFLIGKDVVVVVYCLKYKVHNYTWLYIYTALLLSTDCPLPFTGFLLTSRAFYWLLRLSTDFLLTFYWLSTDFYWLSIDFYISLLTFYWRLLAFYWLLHISTHFLLTSSGFLLISTAFYWLSTDFYCLV